MILFILIEVYRVGKEMTHIRILIPISNDSESIHKYKKKCF